MRKENNQIGILKGKEVNISHLSTGNNRSNAL